jgi:two-component system, NarL family, response regulator LiaR
MIRILICDDQDMIREGLSLILSSAPDFEVVGTAEDGAKAVEIVEESATKPDLVLMDLKMPIMDGIQATESIKRRFLGMKVLVLTTHSDDEWLFDAIRSGANGFLLKDAPSEDLFRAIRATMAGDTPVDPKMTKKLFDYVSHHRPLPDAQLVSSLNPRELEILRLIARGFTNTAISETVHLSEGTVRNYISTIFSKLNVADRTQAALLALRYGLVKVSDL